MPLLHWPDGPAGGGMPDRPQQGNDWEEELDLEGVGPADASNDPLNDSDFEDPYAADPHAGAAGSGQYSPPASRTDLAADQHYQSADPYVPVDPYAPQDQYGHPAEEYPVQGYDQYGQPVYDQQAYPADAYPQQPGGDQQYPGYDPAQGAYDPQQYPQQDGYAQHPGYAPGYDPQHQGAYGYAPEDPNAPQPGYAPQGYTDEHGQWHETYPTQQGNILESPAFTSGTSYQKNFYMSDNSAYERALEAAAAQAASQPPPQPQGYEYTGAQAMPPSPPPPPAMPPPPPPAAEMPPPAPTPATYEPPPLPAINLPEEAQISSQPPQESIGGHQQLSIKNLGRQEPEAPVKQEWMAPIAPPPPTARPSAPLDPPSAGVAPTAGKPNYAAQSFGNTGGPAVNADGVPLFVPDLPTPKEDEGASGRRVAGVTWIFLAALMGLGFASAGLLNTGAPLFGPMALLGILLLTGNRGVGILSILFTILFALATLAVGGLMVSADPSLERLVGERTLPPTLGYAFGGVGLGFLLGSMMMLVGRPGMGRAMVGAVLVILISVGSILGSTISSGGFAKRVTNPVGGPEAETVGSSIEGFTIDKPAGWLRYEWADVQEVSPLAFGLVNQPNYHFLNEDQTMLLTAHLDTAPARSFAALLGQDVLSDLEKELTRGLPPKNNTPESFNYAGISFLQNSYFGTPVDGPRMGIHMARGRMEGKTLILAVTWLGGENRDAAPAPDAKATLDTVVQSLRLTTD